MTTTGGLRELKKQRTRIALIDAALELFLKQGYERTTIDEIVAAVEVSQRTFFRYFATKEDVVFGVMSEYDRMMVETIRSRPPGETPEQSLIASMHDVLLNVEEGDEVEVERVRRLREVIETTPALVVAQLARHLEIQRTLTEEIARRMGIPATDLRPATLVAIYMAALRLGFEDCGSRNVFEPRAVVERVEQAVTLALGALRKDWWREQS